MRGKGVKKALRLAHKGITPAYAGKSSSRGFVCKEIEDHPRLCGEKAISMFLCASSGGSPPPMRGKVPNSAKKFTDSRITPAYAGKSSDT